MVLKLRSFGLLFACTTGLAVAGVVSAQPPAPTADRPHLAKDAKQAMDFLATWARITSSEEYFKDATYVGSEGCKGSGCHDQQVQEWRTTGIRKSSGCLPLRLSRVILITPLSPSRTFALWQRGTMRIWQ